MMLCTFSCIKHRMPVMVVLNWLAGIVLIKCAYYLLPIDLM